MKTTLLAAAIAMTPMIAVADTPKEIVRTVVTKLFVEGDTSVVDTYFSKDYLQHNPTIPNGPDAIKGAFGNLPPNFKYEIGMIIADDDLVAVHGRYTGFGPTPMIAVDIFRVEDDKVVEHWDVLQPEVTETASGLPMFTPEQ